MVTERLLDTGSDSPEGSDLDDSSVSGKSKKLEDPIARKVRLEREARDLEAALADGVVSDLKTRVAWILNLFPHTRNSDVALTIKYWEMFQQGIFNSISMSPRDLFRLERESYLVRVRAKIQNEYKLFPADPEVRRHRRSREEDMKDAVVEDRAHGNIIFSFSDETGKNDEFVIVSSVWVLTGHAMFKLSQAIIDWQAGSPWAGREIHFTDLKKHHVGSIDGYLDVILRNREFLSIKVIAVRRADLRRPITEIVQRLHEFMLVRGAEHELRSNRISLPQTIRLTVDHEQSLDVIACADIQSRVNEAYRAAYGEDLTVDSVKTISSHKSQLVQLADVVAGAVNRRRNHRGERGYKDDIADAILSRLDVQLDEGEVPGVDSSAWLCI